MAPFASCTRKRSDKDQFLSEKLFREMFLYTEGDILGNIHMNNTFNKNDKSSRESKYNKKNFILYTPSCGVVEPKEPLQPKNKNPKKVHPNVDEICETGRRYRQVQPVKIDLISLIVQNISSKTKQEQSHSNLTNKEKQFLQYYHSTDDPSSDNGMPQGCNLKKEPRKQTKKAGKQTKSSKVTKINKACELSFRKQEQKLRNEICFQQPKILSENSLFVIKNQTTKTTQRFPMFKKVQNIIKKYEFDECNSNIIFTNTRYDNNCRKLYISLQDTILFRRMLYYPGFTKMRNSKSKNNGLFISNTVKNFLKSDHVHVQGEPVVRDSWDQDVSKCCPNKENVICAKPDRYAADFLNTTNLILLMMFKDELLDSLNYVLEETKEHILINATLGCHYKKGDENKNCMIKIFKSRKPNKKSSIYAVHAIRKYQAEIEEQILIRMNRFSINAPQFIISHEHIMVMALPGNNDICDRSLNKLKLNPSEWVIVYEELIKLVRKLYECCILTKGILSIDNILWYNKKCYIMNAVPAEGLLTKIDVEHVQYDCDEIAKFFRGKIPHGNLMRKISPLDIAHEVYCDKRHCYRGDVCIAHNDHCGEILLYREIRNMVKVQEDSSYDTVFIPRIFKEVQLGIDPKAIADYIKNTNNILRKAIQQEKLASLNHKICDGKNFILLNANLWTIENQKKIETKCLVKIFKIKNITCGRHREYLRKLAETEKQNLQIMEAHHINAPRFIELHEHVVFMRYPGNNEIQGRALIDLNIKHSEWVHIYKEVTDLIQRLYRDAKLAYGDLSQHSIIWYDNRVSLANASDCISISHYSALDRLKRDCRWISKFFSKKNVPNVKEAKPLYCSITGLTCHGM